MTPSALKGSLVRQVANNSLRSFACKCVCTFSAIASFSGCGTREPYRYFPVSGTLAYEDGSLIPVEHVVLLFHPQTDPRDARTHPRPASAVVDQKTGTFTYVTSHKPSDGLMACKYKVTLHLPSRLPLPPECAAESYADANRTPLEVEGGLKTLAIRITKPVK